MTPPVAAKRDRGRPRKTDVGESSNAGAKRGRGRPPKVNRGGDGGAAVTAPGGGRSPSPLLSLGLPLHRHFNQIKLQGLKQLPH